MVKERNVNNLPQSEKEPIDYSQKVLEVKNLKKYFYLGKGPNRTVLRAVDGISFDIYKGEVFGLVGESGCGKTTTGRTIIKLYNPTDGSIYLNGTLIGAGDLSYRREIQRVKREAKERILLLDKSKYQIVQLRREADAKIKRLRYQIEDLEDSYNRDIKAIDAILDEYNTQLYRLKNQYELDIDNIKYQANLKIAQIKEKLTNRFEIEYNNQLKIAKRRFENKLDGLKNSAALTKEAIQQRIEELQREHAEELKALKEKYLPLIEAEKDNILSKKEVKEQIAKLKEETKQLLEARKAKYREERSKVQKPDFAALKAEKAKITANYKKKLAELNSQIRQIKEETKAAIKAVPKSKAFTAMEKEKIKQIKEEAKEKIEELKEKIRETKRINKSKETWEVSRKMQMIFQDPISSLNPRMTVREIIGEGLKIRGGYSEETIDEMVAEALKIVGLLPEYASRYPHEFSGGQRQRIGIARALVMNPDFIIADEPISALDVSIRAQILNLLTDLRDKFGLTILFIAHDLSVVRFFCDRIAVMYNGKIVEMASAEELFNNPLHPYTISLLSAIPQPDPDYEKGRKRIHYDPSIHDYREDKPSMREIAKGHFVYVNNKEFEELKEKYYKNKQNEQEPKN